MTGYTDDELSLMHLDGIACPDDDHARERYAALDEVDRLLGTLDAPRPGRDPTCPCAIAGRGCAGEGAECVPLPGLG